MEPVGRGGTTGGGGGLEATVYASQIAAKSSNVRDMVGFYLRKWVPNHVSPKCLYLLNKGVAVLQHEYVLQCQHTFIEVAHSSLIESLIAS